MKHIYKHTQTIVVNFYVWVITVYGFVTIYISILCWIRLRKTFKQCLTLKINSQVLSYDEMCCTCDKDLPNRFPDKHNTVQSRNCSMWCLLMVKPVCFRDWLVYKCAWLREVTFLGLLHCNIQDLLEKWVKDEGVNTCKACLSRDTKKKDKGEFILSWLNIVPLSNSAGRKHFQVSEQEPKNV